MLKNSVLKNTPLWYTICNPKNQFQMNELSNKVKPIEVISEEEILKAMTFPTTITSTTTTTRKKKKKTTRPKTTTSKTTTTTTTTTKRQTTTTKPVVEGRVENYRIFYSYI